MRATVEELLTVFQRSVTLTEASSMHLINLLINAFECKRVFEQGLFLGGVPTMLHALNRERGLEQVATETMTFALHEGSRVHYQKILTNRGFTDINLSEFTSLEMLERWVKQRSSSLLGSVPSLKLYPDLNSVNAQEEPFDFIHMDCTDEYDDAKNRIRFMLDNLLAEDGIFCVDDFNSAEGFMRALAIGSVVAGEQLWPLACDLRKVYFTRKRNAVDRLVSYMQPSDYDYPGMKIHLKTTVFKGEECRFLIAVGKR